MKICLISFDFWHYDEHIVRKLNELDIEAHHINIGAFSHKHLGSKISNALSKIFLGKNLKYQKRQRFVIESLEKIGFQDQILVLNPDTLDSDTLQFIKEQTHRCITYLYDSLERYPVQDKLHFFDKIFSFDDKDVREFGFEKLTNYNYLEYLPAEAQNPQLDLYYITSYDKNRNGILQKFAPVLQKKGISYRFLIVGKRVWKEQIKVARESLRKYAVLKRKTIPAGETISFYRNTKAILELMRAGQTGLSFRFFEAMALEKKIITNNREIINYDFYTPENILILEDDFSNLNKDFFEKPYRKLSQNIYDYYTLDKWVDRVFDLK